MAPSWWLWRVMHRFQAQSASRQITQWVDVTNRPILNLTSLRYELTAFQSATNRFFRLRQQ